MKSRQFPLIPDACLHSLWRVNNVFLLNLCIKDPIVFPKRKLKVASLIGDLSGFLYLAKISFAPPNIRPPFCLR